MAAKYISLNRSLSDMDGFFYLCDFKGKQGNFDVAEWTLWLTSCAKGRQFDLARFSEDSSSCLQLHSSLTRHIKLCE
jgi:hypothetical protein